jgi:hypothetical protein
MKRLPMTTGPDRTDGVVYAALGVAAAVAVTLFLTSVMQVSANSRRIAVALERQTQAVAETLLADQTTNTHAPGAVLPGVPPIVAGSEATAATDASTPRPRG